MLDEYTVYNDCINGREKFANGKLCDASKYFSNNGFFVFKPYTKNKHTKMVLKLYKKQPVFASLEATDLEDIYTAYKMSMN
jgi:hypothetical protein